MSRLCLNGKKYTHHLNLCRTRETRKRYYVAYKCGVIPHLAFRAHPACQGPFSISRVCLTENTNSSARNNCVN